MSSFKIKIKSIIEKEQRYLNKRVMDRSILYEFYCYDEKTKMYGIRQCTDHNIFNRKAWNNKQIEKNLKDKEWTLIT